MFRQSTKQTINFQSLTSGDPDGTNASLAVRAMHYSIVSRAMNISSSV